MIEKKMVVLWPLLIQLAIGVSEEIRTNDYEVTINDGVLTSLKNLQETDELDLSNRGIKEIEIGIFKYVDVKILNLESNEISKLEFGTFSGLDENLEVLNLGSNRINVIDSPFVGLRNLKLLNFSDNPIGYFAAGELFGVPQTADILLKGNELHTLSTSMFEKVLIDPYDEESSLDAKKANRNEPNHLADSLVSLKEKTQIFYVTDSIIDYDQKPDLGYEGSTIICLEDSILKKVGILREGEILPENCDDIVVGGGIRYLELQNRGIKSIAKGWYQLQKIPIAFIDLSRNYLTEFSPEILNDLPESVKIVDLSHNLIKKIKKDAFSNVHLKGISFKKNLIEDVEDGSFELSNLWGLYFTENRISDISFLAHLPVTLNQLYLEANRILHITDGIFFGLKNLKQLDLSRNAITKIQTNAFEGLTSLNAMDLGYNQISNIEAGSLLGLKNLDRVSYNGNSISSCDQDAFDGLGNLTSLHLAFNKFTNITRENFCRLPSTLLHLDLQGNGITDIEKDFFVRVPRNTLKLDNNKLSKILPTHFKIAELEELYLGNNSITEISPDSFRGLPALRFLSLAKNQISEIPKDTVKHLNALNTFDISRNPIIKLQTGVFYGIRKSLDSEVFVDDNKIEFIQGGIFENL